MNIVEHGCERLPALLSTQAVAELRAALDRLQLAPLRGGIRRIESLLPEVAALACSRTLTEAAAARLDGPPRLVRAIFFDKTAANNWLVAWHQDRTVAVTRRFEADEWGPWSVKAGICHVQPPLAVLERMLTLRVHLDETGRRNACLKVIAGSHRLGLLDAAGVRAAVAAAEPVYCEAAAGDVLAMRPHLLHASEKALDPGRRRILHFEYCSHLLPDGVQWAA